MCDEITGSADVLIEGLALTDPRFSKYPMLLSLLKFHSPSIATNNEDNTSSSAVAVHHTVELGGSKNTNETAV